MEEEIKRGELCSDRELSEGGGRQCSGRGAVEESPVEQLGTLGS